MPVDPHGLCEQLGAIERSELLERYQAGHRDFSGVNLLGSYIARLADGVPIGKELPQRGMRFGYWKDTVSPLWVDRNNRMPLEDFEEWGPLFDWNGDRFACALAGRADERQAEVDATDLSGADLPDIDLRGSYLYRVDFRGANLTSAKFQRAILVDVNMAGATLLRADFRECYTVELSFRKANGRLCRFERAKLTGADFTEASLVRAKFPGANLGRTRWAGANLHYAKFERNSLAGADLRGLDLGSTRLKEAVVDGARLHLGQENALLDALGIERTAQAENACG